MSDCITYINTKLIASYKNRRANELHVVDKIQVASAELSLTDNLHQAKKQGAKFAIIGIPEDIGPRANCGKGGADQGWNNFLPVFLNQQANSFFDWNQCLLIGNVDVSRLQDDSYKALSTNHKLATLRELCAELDNRVIEALTPIFESGLEPIVIGGGHNNAYPIICSLNQVSQSEVACVNLDPHADFRPMEGRHSGNPFRYAYDKKMLSHYCVLGLHEQKNNQQTIDALHQANFEYITFQSMFMTQQKPFSEALGTAGDYVSKSQGPIGIELDLDCIKQAAASAYSVSGFSLEQAIHYVYYMAKLERVKYLHLCEGAPELHEHSEYGAHDVGQILTQLVYSYLKARV